MLLKRITGFEYQKKHELQIRAALRKQIEERPGDQLIQSTTNKKNIAELAIKVDLLEEWFVNDEISGKQCLKKRVGCHNEFEP